MRPLKEQYDIFFFFPYYHIGGAEKVHYQIIQSIPNKKVVIYFTKKSSAKDYYMQFEMANCTIKDISKYTDNKWLYWLNVLYRGIISSYINAQHNAPNIFNGQCNFGYKLAPWINKGVKQIELIHALNSFSIIRIPYLNYYTQSITVAQSIIALHTQLYQHIKVPQKYTNAMQYIESKVILPTVPITKKITETIHILYVGRSTSEKRAYLIPRIAEQLQHYTSITFTIISDYTYTGTASNINVVGTITDADMLNAYYTQSHIVLIPSSTESGPLVLLEAMSNSCVVIGTPVGLIPKYIHNGTNGYCIQELTDDDAVVNQMTRAILNYTQANYQYKIAIHDAASATAYTHFDMKVFTQYYQKLLA